ncbi:MAG: UDP-N-acetylmuramate:L-alanyl-gamma-D-glutamyl-meso-diaminopimelate ligase [bacterium]|jgi:UDP-N-acetylmuramate: L-alanyl-gamma-D-glutamyl-meso-diaminopimelate ligase|nr:UDP-N-acetylmuramate:L-alanyl-gamma-D-glutamyl-meso-diaminopimelate ligase [candidate division KSB1 bacterium]MDH7559980.1 UDP-N-acetylmuramate:L-alanyl-gamma-D-glutamyl-meso-diaminopimelate ligase [bacterium]
MRRLDPGSDIYFIAICGTAMAALAAMLKNLGYRVRGSDKDVYPPMSTFLAAQGIPVYEGFDAAHLEPAPDLVVIGNAMSRGNPEVEAVLARKLHYTSMPEALKEFVLRDRYSVVVTGTHGKTTTSSMIAWALECAGRDPGFLIGGVPCNFQQGFKCGSGRHFVVEGDEYDTAFFDKGPKFMHYLPDVAVINNIEFDHADIYPGLDEIKLAFRRFINIIPGNGLLVAAADDPVVMELAPRALCAVHTFGLRAEATWRALDIAFADGGTRFVATYQGKKEGEFHTKLTGMHNVRNALAAIATCRFLGLSFQEIAAALATFEGVRKRLELRAEVNGIKIYDDFAHHPTAIRETLNGVRALQPGASIWALYEPRTATARRKVFQKEFAQSFAAAEHVVVAPVHRPDKVRPEELFSVPELVADLRARGKDAYHFPEVDAIVTFVAAHARPGDVIVTLSNGDFEGIPDKLKTALERKYDDGARQR